MDKIKTSHFHIPKCSEKNDSFLLTHFLNNANFKVAFLSRARSAMKSIIFDLSVSRQHGELLQGLQAADMFLSAKNFHIVFESIEICRCDITGFFVLACTGLWGRKLSVYRHIRVYCFIYIKNRESYWILNKKLCKRSGWCDYNPIMQGPRFPFSEISQRATS